jgi:transcriptional regulator with XRE-family HTH domain
VTGRDVFRLRADLGWTGAQFASLFGVHPSTVYRWEDRETNDLKTEPLQLQLLTVLRGEIKRRNNNENSLKKFSERMEDALALGGSLRALHVLLSFVYAPPAPPDAVIP